MGHSVIPFTRTGTAATSSAGPDSCLGRREVAEDSRVGLFVCILFAREGLYPVAPVAELGDKGAQIFRAR